MCLGPLKKTSPRENPIGFGDAQVDYLVDPAEPPLPVRSAGGCRLFCLGPAGRRSGHVDCVLFRVSFRWFVYRKTGLLKKIILNLILGYARGRIMD